MRRNLFHLTNIPLSTEFNSDKQNKILEDDREFKTQVGPTVP